MIRLYNRNDLPSILDIWLQASIQAHDFMPSDFWESQLSDVRDVYIPSSETYVYEMESKAVGFYSLSGDTLAAIFVSPSLQGRGIGKQLLNHAKSKRDRLILSVYKENVSSYQFYLSQEFKVVKEQRDEHTGHPEYLMSTKI